MTLRSGFKSLYAAFFGLFSCLVTNAADSDTKVLTAKDTAAPGPAQHVGFQFGIARMQDLSQASLYFQDLQVWVMKKSKSLEKRYIAFRKSLDAKARRIQALVKSGVNANAETIREKQLALQKEAAAEEKKFQLEQREIQNFQQGHTMEILRQLRLIFKTVGKKRNLTVVFDADGVLYVDPDQAVDVTAEVLAQLNASYDKKVFEKEAAAEAKVKPVKGGRKTAGENKATVG
jgi:Skp family chaperone for outer membrane proteins